MCGEGQMEEGGRVGEGVIAPGIYIYIYIIIYIYNMGGRADEGGRIVLINQNRIRSDRNYRQLRP